MQHGGSAAGGIVVRLKVIASARPIASASRTSPIDIVITRTCFRSCFATSQAKDACTPQFLPLDTG